MRQVIKAIIISSTVGLFAFSCGSKQPLMDGRNVHHLQDLEEAQGRKVVTSSPKPVRIDSIVDPEIQKVLKLSEENKKNHEQTKETLDKLEEIIREVTPKKN